MNVAAGHEEFWSENLSASGTYADASGTPEPEAGKYEDEQNRFDGDRMEKQEGKQVNSEERPVGVERMAGAMSAPSVPSVDTSPPADAHVSITDHQLKEEATTNAPLQEDTGEKKAVPTTEELAESNYYNAVDASSLGAKWEQHGSNYRGENISMASAEVGEGPSELTDESRFQSERDQRYQSRSSTPSSSRNMSPSDLSRHAWSANSSSISAARFAGELRPPFVSMAPAPAVARHPPPFPFFANPFMVPFAPHLPQANVSQQSPTNGNSTPEDWANIAGVRRNPDSGGFFLHPQYYHELLQQYFRNMAMSDPSAAESNDTPASAIGEEGRANAEAQTISDSEISTRAEAKSFDRAGISGRRAGNVDSARPVSCETDVHSSSRQGTPLTEWHEDGQGTSSADETNGPVDFASIASNEYSVDVSAEASPQKATRPETLPLEENLDNDPSVYEENARSNPTGIDPENPAMALIRKQISEIEKQILRTAQNQNIRKMDAKEIEAFLLMEQQRTLEANLFESTTNAGAWAPSAFPWLQNDSVQWERAAAVADAYSRQQFEPVADQRSLYELAAVAAAAASADNTKAPSPELGQASGFVQAHFPQATSGFVPQPPYSSPVPWPPAAFYHPGAASAFGYPGASAYFTPSAVYGAGLPPQYVANAHGYPPAVPPVAVMQPFPAGHVQQRQMGQENAVRNSYVLPTPEQAITGCRGGKGETDEAMSSAPDHTEEDEPVWVLRESYVRKLKREEERQAEKERAAKQVPSEPADKAVPDSDVYNETDKLLDSQRNDSAPQEHGGAPQHDVAPLAQKKAKKKKEVMVHEPAVLIEGVLFRGRYLGSTQLVCDGRPTKATRMMQAQEAVSRIKAPDGEPQPSTDVDLFISTEKIMVLNTDLQDIMMDHPLRTISYIADIGDLVVLMARRMSQSSPESPEPAISRTPKVICHVFESEEAQFIAQSIGQAFQVAYMEFLRANGIDDPGYLRDVDYQEVLNSQEIFGEELEMFARKETQKDVVVPKQKNEIFGVVIVESGWGSMLPTVVVANLMPGGPAARSNNLNIGDHIIALNGISFVGLPLSACQNHIRNVKHLTAVKLTVVHTPPVVEVRIKRPDTKYQLGFSVQNGVICSLLRGGIAERGGVRVGHRIIEINSQSVVAVQHEKIVTMLATAVGEIQMKTMPTSMFRLLTGQETPNYI